MSVVNCEGAFISGGEEVEGIFEFGDGLGLDVVGFARWRRIALLSFDANVLAQFFEVDGVFGHAREGVGEERIFFGLLDKHFPEESNVKAIEDLLELGAGEVDHGVGKRHGIVIGGETARPVAKITDDEGAFLGAEPILEAAFVPVVYAVDFDVVVAFGGEELEDGGVGGAVVEHEVDLLAKFGGKACDFARAAMGRDTHDR